MRHFFGDVTGNVHRTTFREVTDGDETVSPRFPNELTRRAATIKALTSYVANGSASTLRHTVNDRVIVRTESEVTVFTAIEIPQLPKLTELLKEKLHVPNGQRITITLVCERYENGSPRMRVAFEY